MLLTLISGLCVLGADLGWELKELDSVIQFLLRIEALVQTFLDWRGLLGLLLIGDRPS